MQLAGYISLYLAKWRSRKHSSPGACFMLWQPSVGSANAIDPCFYSLMVILGGDGGCLIGFPHDLHELKRTWQSRQSRKFHISCQTFWWFDRAKRSPNNEDSKLIKPPLSKATAGYSNSIYLQSRAIVDHIELSFSMYVCFISRTKYHSTNYNVYAKWILYRKTMSLHTWWLRHIVFNSHIISQYDIRMVILTSMTSKKWKEQSPR